MLIGAAEESLIIGFEVAWTFVKTSVILAMWLSSIEFVWGLRG
jgi:hypothetical protein